MSRISPLVLVVAAVVCGWSTTASAQPEPISRPFRGLFGSSGNNPNQQQSVVLTFSGFGGYDDDVLASTQNTNTRDPRMQHGGYFTSGSVQLTHAYSSNRFSIGSDVSTMLRYHPGDDQLNSVNVSGGVGLQKSLGERLGMDFSARAFRAPRYHLGLLTPEGNEAVAFDQFGDAYAVEGSQATGVSSNAGLSYQLSSRSSVNANYGYRFVKYDSSTGNTKRQQGGAGYRYRLGAYSTFRLGYRYQGYGSELDSDGDSARLGNHNFVAGIDFSRPWSLSGRRTELAVHPGWTLLQQGGSTRVRATGSARLSHQLGRSWSAQVEYSKAVRYVEGIDILTYTDGVYSGVSGLLGRRVQVVLSGAYSTGQYENASKGGLETYTGRAQLQFALSRLLALYGQYFYYVYKFDQTGSLPAWFSDSLERQGIRVGLTVQLPLIQ